MITWSSLTTAPMVVPGGSLILPISLPTTLEVFSSPCAIASIASAAPRRKEYTFTISPRLTWVSRAEIVACCGEKAMSISPPCTKST